MYSIFVGFFELGEFIEEFVRCEVWEESGVRVGRVVVYLSQLWFYFFSLMIGVIVQMLFGEGEIIYLNDKELDMVKWFDFDEV